MRHSLIVVLFMVFNFYVAEAQIYTPGSDQMATRKHQNEETVKAFQLQTKQPQSTSYVRHRTDIITTAHKVLEIEKEFTKVEPDYKTLNSILDRVTKKVETLLTDGATIDEAFVLKVFNSINYELWVNNGFKTKETAFLADVLKIENGKHYADCDVLSILYYSILVDIIGRDDVVIVRRWGHDNMRWKLESGDVDWETTTGKRKYNDEYKKDLGTSFSTELKTTDMVRSIAYYNVANAYGNQQNDQKALEYYDKAIQLSGSDANFYYYKGIVYGGQAKYQMAINIFNKAISLDPENSDSYYWRGIGYQGLKNYPQAIKDLTQAIDDPIRSSEYYPDYYTARGECYTAQGEKDKAKKDFDEARILRSKIRY
ncbi:MAG: tetratricopeptide repeat protein [Pseudomonadota bacterium]